MAVEKAINKVRDLRAQFDSRDPDSFIETSSHAIPDKSHGSSDAVLPFEMTPQHW